MYLYDPPRLVDPPGPMPLADGRSLRFDGPTHLMGIVNVTPDSFSDGGRFLEVDAAVAHGLAMAEAGATLLDIGGESTRPGAEPVPAAREIERVVPVIERLAAADSPPISIDTQKAAVAEAALDAGAALVNDVSGLGRDPDMASVVAERGAGLVIMHMRGTPETMQSMTEYDDLFDEMRAYFDARIERAVAAGVALDAIAVDPGIGFAKTAAQSYRLLRELARLADLGRPVLLGTSRKSFIGRAVERPADERVWGTAATVALGIAAGAHILRLHDIAELGDVARVADRTCGRTASKR